ncbi:MAG: methyltransferase [Duncaniella sp.]|nr:methyltransferase [Duncaniella sp.]
MGVFRFKQFAVDDSGSAMKIGTDGVLLGAWTCADGCNTVIDAGCGTGLIGLMMAQRYYDVNVIGVEIDDRACEDALRNVAASPWSDRMEIVHGDVLAWQPANQSGPLCIVSNPPFFTEQLRSPDSARALARHGAGFGVETLIEWSAGIMTDEDDTLAFIAPAERDDELQYLLALHRLTPLRVTDVVSREGRPPVRRLYQVTRDRRGVLPCAHDMLVIRDRSGEYSPEYISLTGPFYINL